LDCSCDNRGLACIVHEFHHKLVVLVDLEIPVDVPSVKDMCLLDVDSSYFGWLRVDKMAGCFVRCCWVDSEQERSEA